MLEKERLERQERQKNLETKKEKDSKPQRAVSQKLSSSKERKQTSSTSFGDNIMKLFRKSDKDKNKKKKIPGISFIQHLLIFSFINDIFSHFLS